MQRAFAIAMILMLFLAPVTFAPPSRPAITGLGFVRLQVTSLGTAGRFYGDYLGLPLSHECWGPTVATCFFIAPYQNVEILRMEGQHTDVQQSSPLLDTIGIWTANASALRGYLLARGLQPGDLTSPRKGWDQFAISDPEGHHLVFLSLIGSAADRSDATTRVSHHMIHTGFVVRDQGSEDHLYKEILGFRVYWHGGMKEDQTNWVDMQVPDGTDWIEYMLNVSPNATHKTLGVMNHIALGVPDIQAAQQQLSKNGWKATEEPKIGRDGKWQLNLYDPDETRVELMEFKPTKEPCCSPYTGPHPEGPRQ
jgi:catechol 2,3-dioxygenase-like lactoylglutathione lyase family enzyme